MAAAAIPAFGDINRASKGERGGGKAQRHGWAGNGLSRVESQNTGALTHAPEEEAVEEPTRLVWCASAVEEAAAQAAAAAVAAAEAAHAERPPEWVLAVEAAVEVDGACPVPINPTTGKPGQVLPPGAPRGVSVVCGPSARGWFDAARSTVTLPGGWVMSATEFERHCARRSAWWRCALDGL